MNALWYYAIAFIIIWVLALLFKDKLKLDVEGPVIMRKTTRLRGFIDSLAQKSPRIWRWTMNIGIPVSVFFMAYILYVLITSLNNLSQAQVSLIIPGVEVPGSAFFLPFEYGIPALATVLIIHEFGHGIISRVEKVRIKSIGVLLVAILPGAFVEPDEEDVEKSKKLSKLRIFAAGSIFNFGLAAVALLLFYAISLFAVPLAFDSNQEIVGVVSKSPADGTLHQGMIIQSINGYTIKDTNSFTKAVGQIKAGETVTIKTNEGTFNLKTGANPKNPSKGYLGITTKENPILKNNIANVFGYNIPWVLIYLQTLFSWIFILNLGVGSFNLLPLKPLDGGLIFEELLSYVASERNTRAITYAITMLSIFLVVLNVGYGLLSAIL